MRSLLRSNVVEQDVAGLDRLHRPAGRLLHSRANLTGLCVAELPVCLAIPERHAESSSGFAIAKDDVADLAGLVAYSWMNDVANNSAHIRDSVSAEFLSPGETMRREYSRKRRPSR